MAPSVCRTVALCLLLVIGHAPLGIAQQGVGGVRGWSVAEALGRSTARLEKVNSRLSNTRAHSPDSDSNSTDRAGPGRVLQGEERRDREDAVLPLSRLSVPSLNKTSTNTTLSSLLPAVGSLLSSRSERVSGPDKENGGQRRLRGPHKPHHDHHKRHKEVLRLRARSEQSSRSGTEVLYDGAKHDSLVTHTQHQEANTITQALTSHPRALQALPSLWPEQQQDSVAADRLVALSQRLNLSESQRDELRGWVKETALELLRQANPNPTPALSLIPPRHMQAQDKASPPGPSLLSSRDPLLSSPLIDALRSGHLASPPSPPRLLEDKEAEKDLLLPSERLGLSGQDLSSVRAALRESAMGLIKQAVTTSLGTRGQPTNNTHNTSQEGVGSGVEEARQQVTRPDGGSLLNPLTPLHKLPPPHRSLPSSPAPPLLPRTGADPSRPPLGSRLNLTDSERSQLRQAVRDVAIGLLKEARTGEPDKQRSPALALLLPTEPQDERTALIDAIRDVAKARLTQPSTNTALSTSSSASVPYGSGDDLLFHTNRHASPPHRTLPVTLGLQPGTVNTPQDQPQTTQPQGSLAARVSSLSDGEKAELREAVKAAALALLREAAAREFGIATMAKAATAVATTGGF